MKTLSQPCSLFLSLFMLLLLSGCEHSISVHTDVHADGSLDRTIVLHESDSGKIEHNVFGINRDRGWGVLVEPAPKSSAETDKEAEVNITFTRHFASVDDANRDMNNDTDTAFHILSSFEKQNRWFYTYVQYRDTYRALNLFSAIPKEQYFTKEDFEFIDRLPGEGTPISKADSLYLARLNEKIFDLYGSRTIFEEFYQHLVSTMRTHNVPTQWQDTVIRKKEHLYQLFADVANDEEDLLSIVDNLNIPLPVDARRSMQQKIEDIEKRLEFLSEAYSGKYVHSITMPWSVVESNADSVIDNKLLWRPPVVKFLLSDYTMSATARKMNVWAVVASVVIIVVTIGMFVYRAARPTSRPHNGIWMKR